MIVSDAILADNELRLRAGSLAFLANDTRAASVDEAGLLTMIAALQEGSRPLAWQVAHRLGIAQPRMLLILLHRLAGKLAQARVRLEGPFRSSVPTIPFRTEGGRRAVLKVV